MKVAVIIPAAGASSRFNSQTLGQQRSKLDEDLGGKPVLQRTVELFHARDEVGSIIVAGPHEKSAFAAFKLRHGDRLALFGAILCQGGPTHRYETVKAALQHVSDDHTHIAVHDAARPATPAELIDRLFDAAARHPAVVPGVEVHDTLKRVGEPVAESPDDDPVAAILGVQDKGPGPRPVTETLDRTGLVLVQTPQIFKADLLRSAYAQDDLTSTDDATLVERLGQRVLVIEGDRRNIKITRPADVPLVRAMLGLRGPQGRPAHKRF
ncbi:MAG: 2-C-methyl-D-erythritol 4-phosphate cytidylyltransferase [Planctomycetota bacterium]|nr:MAG: 2-C-methyl-D-erythritol 4-phosphate cytidylyltransferase [Planctomycetota bacterium]